MVFRCAVAPSPVTFKRVLGASCAVYPALFFSLTLFQALFLFLYLLPSVFPSFFSNFPLSLFYFVCCEQYSLCQLLTQARQVPASEIDRITGRLPPTQVNLNFIKTLEKIPGSIPAPKHPEFDLRGLGETQPTWCPLLTSWLNVCSSVSGSAFTPNMTINTF